MHLGWSAGVKCMIQEKCKLTSLPCALVGTENLWLEVFYFCFTTVKQKPWAWKMLHCKGRRSYLNCKMGRKKQRGREEQSWEKEVSSHLGTARTENTGHTFTYKPALAQGETRNGRYCQYKISSFEQMNMPLAVKAHRSLLTLTQSCDFTANF